MKIKNNFIIYLKECRTKEINNDTEYNDAYKCILKEIDEDFWNTYNITM